ncbi:NAD(P)/FAD-dependent oxidoreductase [Nocardia sp. 2]|uniref:NAD(P)/FAD-dependent oxidoreductase n=1 Tax=Nocardia acididurans TaxID=2802282 RepID=A0ABS1M1G5_9NOCA|nr:NAD(P)/FAD-dependent oxidoreductase [Nocardia acididurans]MBL1074493.1 NAD(P)/FAD-dependent oxidoreductase [Nocardia acididurans]
MTTAPEHYDVAIIGSGFSGIGVAIELRRQGIDNFVILERADAIGGTWRDNVYPGCAVDVPSVLYSYSFAPNPNWTRLYATQPELRGYTEAVVDRFDLRGHVRLRSAVTDADFDEAAHLWTVRLADGREVRARAVVMGYFSLHAEAVPDIPGRTDFAGPQMHSSKWDTTFEPAGKRIAVIGSGASAVQIVPALARTSARVLSFQRSAAWVLPRGDRPIPPAVRKLLRRVPPVRLAARALVFTFLEALHLAEFHPRLVSVYERICLAALKRQVPDPETRRKLTPDYRFGCKRPMVSDEYYAAFARPTVDLVTEKIIEITENGVRTADGVHHEVDAIVWATGFHIQDSIARFPDFRTPATSTRRKFARDGFTAYRGIAFAGLPNLFAVTGPNTALPHTSQFLAIEPTTRLIARTISHMRAHHITRYTPDAAAEREWVSRARTLLSSRVWSVGGCTNYFTTPDGTNTLTFPGGTWTLRRDRGQLRLEDWRLGDAV